jgi:hypothetical protein
LEKVQFGTTATQTFIALKSVADTLPEGGNTLEEKPHGKTNLFIGFMFHFVVINGARWRHKEGSRSINQH